MPETVTPPNGEPDEASDPQASDPRAAPADEAETDAPVFANRAERRAKGKGKSSVQAQPQGRGQYPGGRGPVQTQRQYGNRRTG